MNALVDVFFVILAQFQAKCHIVINRHVRIQRIVLENHGNIAIFWCFIVNDATVNQKFALGNVFQAGNHAQGC